MEDKILGFQFVLVSAKSTHPSYNDGSDQDEPQKQPSEVFCRKSALRNFANLTVKHLDQSFFLKKTLLKKRLWHRYFTVNFAKFLRSRCLQSISGRLLLEPETQHNRLSSHEWRDCQN